MQEYHKAKLRTLSVMVDIWNLRYGIQNLVSLPRYKYLVALVCHFLNSLDRHGHVFQLGDKSLVTLLREYVLLEECFGCDKASCTINTLPTYFYSSYILARLFLGIKNTAQHTFYFRSQFSQR